MMHMFKRRATRAILLPFAAVFLLAGCSGGGDQTADAGADTLKLKVDDQMLKRVSDVMITVPSPLEMSSLMKKSGTKYAAGMLSNPAAASKYNTSFKQALNLGIYGADLGYVAYFNQSDYAGRYLRAATTLANNLNIQEAFEPALLERVEKNLNQQDSLLYIITEQYEAAESHLKSVQRPQVAALIVAGGWIEGLYLATQLQKQQPNEQVRTRIGEVLISLNGLLQLLNMYKTEEGIQPLYDQLTELRKIYDDVKITYNEQPAKVSVDAAQDLKVVTTGTTSTVEVSAETITAITAKIGEIRQSIVS